MIRIDCNPVFVFSQGKMKAEKIRAKVSESYVKLAHAQRQELAQQRREDKRRVEKERLLSEEDPDKARRLEVSHNFFSLQISAPLTFRIFLNKLNPTKKVSPP